MATADIPKRAGSAPLQAYRISLVHGVFDWAGVSTSLLCFDGTGLVVFEGVVSLENNGGLASVRTPLLKLGAPDTIGPMVCHLGRRPHLQAQSAKRCRL